MYLVGISLYCPQKVTDPSSLIGSHGGDPVNRQGIVSLLRNNFRLGPLLSREFSFSMSSLKDTAEEYYHFQRMERDNRGRPRENREKGTRDGLPVDCSLAMESRRAHGGGYNARFESSIRTQYRTFTSDP